MINFEGIINDKKLMQNRQFPIGDILPTFIKNHNYSAHSLNQILSINLALIKSSIVFFRRCNPSRLKLVVTIHLDPKSTNRVQMIEKSSPASNWKCQILRIESSRTDWDLPHAPGDREGENDEGGWYQMAALFLSDLTMIPEEI